MKGDYAYVSALTEGFIFDISDPTNPTVANTNTFTASDFEIFGDYLYTWYWNSPEFKIFDISTTPATPILLDEVDAIGTSGVEQDLYADSEYAFFGNANGIWVYDVSNPNSATIELQYTDINSIRGVYYKEPYLYATRTSGNLYILEVSTDPFTLTPVGNCVIPDGYVCDVEVYGDYAYVMQGRLLVSGGLQIIDISNPANPTVENPISKEFLDIS